jgi:hypothetical protein
MESVGKCRILLVGRTRYNTCDSELLYCLRAAPCVAKPFYDSPGLREAWMIYTEMTEAKGCPTRRRQGHGITVAVGKAMPLEVMTILQE